MKITHQKILTHIKITTFMVTTNEVIGNGSGDATDGGDRSEERSGK